MATRGFHPVGHTTSCWMRDPSFLASALDCRAGGTGWREVSKAWGKTTHRQTYLMPNGAPGYTQCPKAWKDEAAKRRAFCLRSTDDSSLIPTDQRAIQLHGPFFSATARHVIYISLLYAWVRSLSLCWCYHQLACLSPLSAVVSANWIAISSRYSRSQRTLMPRRISSWQLWYGH